MADALMATSFPPALLERLRAARIVAGFSVQDPGQAVPLARALLAVPP